MKLGIMQPYFLPYIGYFQLLNAVDKYVVYDDIQYTKKGWINRNRILQNGKDVYITLPLEKDSDYLDIKDRKLSAAFDKKKLLNQIRGSYGKAPYFGDIYSLIEEIVLFDEQNLFLYIYNSICKLVERLDIETELIISSSLPFEQRSYKGEEKVLSICKGLQAGTYYNAIGGKELYSQEIFKAEGVELSFVQTQPIVYTQLKNDFVPYLSILDVMMFNSKEEVKGMLQKYTLVK